MTRPAKRIIPGLALLIGALLSFPTPAVAQLCGGPDGLTGPCCTPTTVTIPTPLPPLSFPAASVCWSSCSPSKILQHVRIDTPTPTFCGNYTAPISISDASFTPILFNTMEMDYSHTWEEVNADGDSLQVWRFLVKVDLIPTSAFDLSLCQSPTCASAGITIFYYGHVDYALNCSTGGFEGSVSLFHPCDQFIHQPLASSIPGSYHPSTSYAIVGPDTTANPFVPTTFPAPFLPGVATGGAIRTVGSPLLTCNNEEPIANSSLGYYGSICACPLNPTLPPQYSAQPLTVTTVCGSGAGSIWTPAPLLWIMLITVDLGVWTGSGPGTPYPGNETLRAAEGFFFHTDGCFGIPFVEMDYGVATEGGFPVLPNADRPWLTDRKLSLASNYSKSAGITPPFVGTILSKTFHMINLNF